MSFWEILLLGVGLSMDAAAVSMTNGMVYSRSKKTRLIAAPVFYAVFQAFMPLIGFFAGTLFKEIINNEKLVSDYSGYLVCLILGILGVKMLIDGIKELREPKTEKIGQKLTYKLLLIQAVATSIDALAVGIGFSAQDVSIIPAVTIIGVTTLIISAISLLLGRKFGDILESKAQILGGIILFALAIKALF